MSQVYVNQTDLGHAVKGGVDPSFVPRFGWAVVPVRRVCRPKRVADRSQGMGNVAVTGPDRSTPSAARRQRRGSPRRLATHLAHEP